MRPSASLVLETNNLEGGGARAERVAASLTRLMRHLRQQARSLDTLAELVVTHQGLSRAAQSELEREAGRSIAFIRLPSGTGYYEAKNQGFDATRADVVLFGDSDCWPERDWLKELLAPFERPASDEVKVVAGRTTYRPNLLGTAASTIDFMYFHGPFGDPGLTRNFYANNVAFRRKVFDDLRFQPIDGVYRGHCQVMGMRLKEAGVPIHFQPAARTVHRFPDSLKELIELRLHRGADAIALTPHIARTWLPSALGGLASSPASAMLTLSARLGFSLYALNRQDMPPVRGLRRVGCAGVIAGLSALDAAGALRGLLRPSRLQHDLSTSALSYHQDVDRLDRRTAA